MVSSQLVSYTLPMDYPSDARNTLEGKYQDFRAWCQVIWVNGTHGVIVDINV